MNKVFGSVIVLLLILVGGLYALNAYINNGTPAGQGPTGFYNPWGTTPEEYVLLGVFSGTLPCDDCPGIDTTLTLTQYGQYIAEGTYELIEHKKGKSETTKVIGNWTTLRGTDEDSDATVYEINPDGPNPPRFYLRVDDRTLQILGDKATVIPGSVQQVLLKQ